MATLRRCLTMAGAALALVIPGAYAQDSLQTARVTYLSGQSVYIDAGSARGVRPGMAIEVLRGGAPVADLEVTVVSTSRASCRIVRSSVELVVGDLVRFHAAAPVVAAGDSSDSSRAVTRTPPRHARALGLHGRVGARYLLSRYGGGAEGDVTQPSADVRLYGEHIAGSPVGVFVDARARRTTTTQSDASDVDGSTRVYQLAVQVNPVGSPARLTIGRQFATTLSAINLFDGATLAFDRARWSVGVLAGTEPDQLNMGYSTEYRQYGAYTQLHNAPGAHRTWSVTLGAIGSYAHGESNREFLYVQGVYVDRRLSVFVAQEVDHNSQWKQDLGESAISPTSTFATVRVRATDVLSLFAGVDNRRQVRLYRDFVNPETEFDDSFRRGAWGGVQLSGWHHLLLSADARTTSGGPAGTARAYTASAGVAQLFPVDLSLSYRGTRYTSETLDGWLHSGSLGITPLGRLRLDLNGGVRNEHDALDIPERSTLTWVGLDADLGIGRSWYLMLSGYHEREQGGGWTEQGYAGLSFRF